MERGTSCQKTFGRRRRKRPDPRSAAKRRSSIRPCSPGRLSCVSISIPLNHSWPLLTGRVVLIHSTDFHGNAMNRAAPFRVEAYDQLTNSTVSSQGGLNVVAIDYRGFGDSTGHPTEQGVLCDARAAWRWVMHRRRLALQRNQLAARTTTPVSFLEQGGGIYLVGQSLGTGIASRLMLDLARVGKSGYCPADRKSPGFLCIFVSSLSADSKALKKIVRPRHSSSSHPTRPSLPSCRRTSSAA